MAVGSFFFFAAPTAQNSPELHFRFINIQSSLLRSLRETQTSPHHQTTCFIQMCWIIFILLNNFFIVITELVYKSCTNVSPSEYLIKARLKASTHALFSSCRTEKGNLKQVEFIQGSATLASIECLDEIFSERDFFASFYIKLVQNIRLILNIICRSMSFKETVDSTINSYGYGFEDIHDFSSQGGQTFWLKHGRFATCQTLG